MADVPGLIEGAADGAGLGHQFLAHLERARLLVHVLDASEPDLEERFRTIDRELAAYGAGLDGVPQVVVLNKIDLLQDGTEARVVGRPHPAGRRHVVRDGSGNRRSEARALRARTDRRRDSRQPASSSPSILEYRPRPRRGPRFRILRTDRGYRVVGTPPPADELEEALRRIGIKRGAQVEVGDEELEWQ